MQYDPSYANADTSSETTMTIHQPVDLSRWTSRYPLDEHFRTLDAHSPPAPDFWYYQPHDVHSPEDLAITEQMRARVGVPGRSSVPMDLLLPALGEPEHPAATKVGGVPYWPREEWPLDAAGERMQFVAQVCLADSLDVLPAAFVRKRPGDVLLIFREASDEMIWSEDEHPPLVFHWRNLDVARPQLANPDDCPPGLWTPTYFQRLRSRESETQGILTHAQHEIEVTGRYTASKIGGLPVWEQSDSEAEGMGSFFAALHSVNPDGAEYPFPNVDIPPWGEYPHSQNFFMLGDVGTLYLFWDGSRVRWLMQCG